MAKKCATDNRYKIFYEKVKSLTPDFRADIQKNCNLLGSNTFYSRLENPDTLSEAEKQYIKGRAKALIAQVQNLDALVEEMF